MEEINASLHTRTNFSVIWESWNFLENSSATEFGAPTVAKKQLATFELKILELNLCYGLPRQDTSVRFG